MTITKANARWEGTLKDGTGTMRLPSGAFEGRYSFVSRFEKGASKETGTNPEELIAAAHAGCFAMAFSGRLTTAGFPPEYIEADHGKMAATFVRIPALSDVPYPVQMEPNLVVEFYSR